MPTVMYVLSVKDMRSVKKVPAVMTVLKVMNMLHIADVPALKAIANALDSEIVLVLPADLMDLGINLALLVARLQCQVGPWSSSPGLAIRPTPSSTTTTCSIRTLQPITPPITTPPITTIGLGRIGIWARIGTGTWDQRIRYEGRLLGEL
jgi:hypothetical protein